MHPGRAVFLDRDGVLIADVHYLTAEDQIRVLPRVPEALARLRAGGWRLIVATNQSVVARGWITEEDLRRIHRALLGALRERGAEIDAVYYCPHHPGAAVAAYRRACDCRKPGPGMLLRAARDFGLDLQASVIVGDAASDIEAGRRAGCRAVRIDAGGREDRGGADREPRSDRSPGGAGAPDYVAADLWDAAGWILGAGPGA